MNVVVDTKHEQDLQNFNFQQDIISPIKHLTSFSISSTCCTKSNSNEFTETYSNSLDIPESNIVFIDDKLNNNINNSNNNYSFPLDDKNKNKVENSNLLYIGNLGTTINNNSGSINLNNLIVNRKKINFNNIYNTDKPDSPINRIFQTTFTDLSASFKMDLDENDINYDPINRFDILSFFHQ